MVTDSIELLFKLSTFHLTASMLIVTYCQTPNHTRHLKIVPYGQRCRDRATAVTGMKLLWGGLGL